MIDFVTYKRDRDTDPNDTNWYPSSDIIDWVLWHEPELREQRSKEKDTLIQDAGFACLGGILRQEWRFPGSKQTHPQGAVIIAPNKNLTSCDKFAISKLTWDEIKAEFGFKKN